MVPSKSVESLDPSCLIVNFILAIIFCDWVLALLYTCQLVVMYVTTVDPMPEM